MTDKTYGKEGKQPPKLKDVGSVLDSIRDGIAVIDRDHRILYVNQLVLESIGASKIEDVVGKTCHDALFGEPVPCEWCKCGECFETGEPQFSKITIPTSTGEMKSYEVFTYPSFDRENTIVHFVEVARDVTEKTLLETQIKKLATIANTSADAMMSVDLKGDIEFWNAGAEALFGYKKDEILGSDFQIIVPSELKDEAVEKRKEAMEKGYTRFETERLKKDGTHVSVDITLTLIRDEEGNPTGIAGSLKDLSEKKRLEEDYKNLFENARDAISFTDRDGAFVLFNNRFSEMTGYSEKELKTRRITDIVHPKDLSKVLEYDRKRLAGEESPKVYEFRLLRRDGNIIRVEVTASPMRENGEIIGTQGILRDITERELLESQIREAKDHLESIFDTINEAICVIDKDLRVISFNEAFANNLSTPSSEILGKKCYEVIHGYSPEEFDSICTPKCIVLESLERGEPINSVHYHESNGDVIYHESTALPTKNARGETYQVVYVINDITEKKKSEQAIEETNNLLNALSQAQSQFIQDVDPHTLFENLLNSLLSLTKSEFGFIGEILYTEDNKPYLKSRSVTNIAWNEETRKYAPSDMEFHNLKTLFGQVITSEKPVISNEPSKDPRAGGLPEGHPRIDSFLGLPIKSGGKILGMVGIANRPGGYDERIIGYLEPFVNTCATIIDAYRNTERRRAVERKLRFLAEIQSQISESIITMDLDKRILTINPAALTTFGYKESEIIGAEISVLVPPDQEKNSEEFWEQILKDSSISGFEGVRITKDGERIPMELSGVLVQGEDKESSYIIGVSRNIAERKKADEDLKKYASELERSNKLKDLFADIMRHDLLNPLGVIKNVIELLEEDINDPDMNKEFSIMNRNLEKIEELVLAATRFGLVESSVGLEFESRDIKELLQEAVETLQSSAEKKEIKIRIPKKSGFMADVNIFLEDVFSNLISNAIKYSPQKTVISIEIHDNNENWRVEIADKGTGVPHEHKTGIFERFKRVEKGSVKGSGLGLAIVKKVIELHHGDVWVEDNPGGGSVFVFTLPKKRKSNV